MSYLKVAGTKLHWADCCCTHSTETRVALGAQNVTADACMMHNRCHPGLNASFYSVQDFEDLYHTVNTDPKSSAKVRHCYVCSHGNPVGGNCLDSANPPRQTSIFYHAHSPSEHVLGGCRDFALIRCKAGPSPQTCDLAVPADVWAQLPVSGSVYEAEFSVTANKQQQSSLV